jgi:hypothetical protein
MVKPDLNDNSMLQHRSRTDSPQRHLKPRDLAHYDYNDIDSSQNQSETGSFETANSTGIAASNPYESPRSTAQEEAPRLDPFVGDSLLNPQRPSLLTKKFKKHSCSMVSQRGKERSPVQDETVEGRDDTYWSYQDPEETKQTRPEAVEERFRPFNLDRPAGYTTSKQEGHVLISDTTTLTKSPQEETIQKSKGPEGATIEPKKSLDTSPTGKETTLKNIPMPERKLEKTSTRGANEQSLRPARKDNEALRATEKGGGHSRSKAERQMDAEKRPLAEARGATSRGSAQVTNIPKVANNETVTTSNIYDSPLSKPDSNY